MNKKIAISLFIGVALVVGALFFVSSQNSSGQQTKQNENADVVSFSEGVQYIDITARGGYTPSSVVARQGIETVLRINTRGTFDCSLSLVVPKLNYRKILPSTGTEEIRIPSNQAYGKFQGLCSMGMYGFEINFK